ncbi:MAG: NAD(P)/FAD-dependent oxidoreductase [Desulfosarcinaceae bacterium]
MGKTCFSRREFIAAAGMGAAALTLNPPRLSARAAEIGPREKYPVVVIGAGRGGLTAAAYLARAGFPVTVVEQHSVPGGYATAFDRAGGEFRFEVSLHGTAINNNTPAKILEELGILEHLELVPLPDTYRIKTAKGDIVVPQGNPQAFIQQLSQRFPEEAAGISGFVGEMLAIHDETETYGRKGETFKRWTKVFFPLLYPRMWKVRRQTLADLLADHVTDPEVRSALAFLWGYYGLPPEKLSAFYYAIATAGYLKNGSFYIKDRSQRLSDLLAETIAAAGGELIYDTAAEKILIEDQAVSGVVLSDGRTLPARAVVSNASAPSLFNQMLPRGSLPGAYLEKLRRYRPSISCFIVWLGIDRSLRGALPGYSSRVEMGQSPEESYAMALRGDIGNMPYNLCLYDNLYEGYSAPGTATLQIFTLSGYAPWRRFEADYRGGEKTAYAAEKKRWADTLIRRAEADLLPGLTRMIAVREAATPLTNWRFTGNTEGAIYGYEQSMQNAFMNRIDNQTPIKGLYLAGAWGEPGGGFTGVLRSGRRTFEQMMAAWGA